MAKFSPLWYQDQVLGEWITEVTGEPTRAFCEFCGISLQAHYSKLKKHSKTKRHIGAGKLLSSKKVVRLNKSSSGQSARNSSSHTSSSLRQRQVNTHRPSHRESTEQCVYIQDINPQPTGTPFHSPEKLREFSVAVTPDMSGDHSVIPVVGQPGEACGFLPAAGATATSSYGPVSSNGQFYNYYREDSDDLNYLFGLCVGAGLKKCSEEQASLARLKIQTIMHQAAVNELQL